MDWFQCNPYEKATAARILEKTPLGKLSTVSENSMVLSREGQTWPWRPGFKFHLSHNFAHSHMCAHLCTVFIDSLVILGYPTFSPSSSGWCPMFFTMPFTNALPALRKLPEEQGKDDPLLMSEQKPIIAACVSSWKEAEADLG